MNEEIYKKSREMRFYRFKLQASVEVDIKTDSLESATMIAEAYLKEEFPDIESKAEFIEEVKK